MRRRQCLYRNARQDIRIHRSGFSLFAALMLPVWAVRHRLYRTAAAVWGGSVALGIVTVLVSDRSAWGLADLAGAAAFTLQSALSGILAPRWQAFVLRRDGYVVFAKEPE